MIITIPWLKEHLNTKANEAKIIEQLTNIGLEVEGIKESLGELSEFKIAKVLKVEKHPNADKLKVCEISLGKSKSIRVVCGATNVREGLTTIYAPPGAIIPKSQIKLKIAKIRGVESSGMLCSGNELGLSNETDGIVELKNKEKDVGSSYFKSKKEKAIDISITPNRADCLGVRGIARDLASSGLGKLLKINKKTTKQNIKQPIKVSISKEKKQGCLSFGSCFIKNITNKESPSWLKDKITAIGLKPISAVVDITNYVMFDLNRPLHAYDADKIEKEIIVRGSKEGENFEALDYKKYKLKTGMCVITDKTGILGLGGIIGGTKTSTKLETKNILLESAYFTPASVRKTSKLLNITTDAKYRFERGIDPNSVKEGLETAATLIVKICGGEASKFTFTGAISKKKTIIDLDFDKFKKVIGITITSKEVNKILSSLGCNIKNGKNCYRVEVPSWRPDIIQDIDLVEELIRIKGFDQIELTEPEKKRKKETLNFKQKLFHLSQRALASKGYMEAVTWSFTDSKVDKQFSKNEKEIKIYNPISSDLDVLRRSIFSNLSIYMKKNQDRGNDDLSLFEVGPTFFGKNPGEQQTVVGALKSGLIGRKNWLEKSRNIDVFDIKSDTIKTLKELGVEENDLYVSNETKSCYHPGRSGSVNLKSAQGLHLAYFGEIHPAIITNFDFKDKNIFGFEIFLKNIPDPVKKLRLRKKNYIISDYQKSERDFAFVIERSYNVGDLEKLIKDIDLDIIKNVTTFDIFEGQNIPVGKKSVAINVVIQASDKTLSEQDLEHISQKIIKTVKDKTGATIRT